MSEVEQALEDLAHRFEMSGDTVVWTSAEIADAIRRSANQPR